MFGFIGKLNTNTKNELFSASVLVIEDNATDRIFFERILTKRGFRVFTAQNSEEGMALAALENVDVILLDYVLPDRSGLEVCRILKEDKRTRMIPIIFLTVVAEGYAMMECFEAGAAAFLTKPISAKELVREVELTLREAREDDNA